MKKTILSILKMIITMFLVFLTPFILPLILKLFLNLKWFSDINEFESIIKIFYNIYPIIYIIITVILLLWFFHKWEDIKNFINNRDFLFNFKEKTLSAKTKIEEEINEDASKKQMIKEIKAENKENDSKNAIQEAKELLSVGNTVTNAKCEQCNKNELESENRNLRYYAAYNIINLETKSLLHVIYNDKRMKTDSFKSKIIQGYTKRNKKNIKFNKKDINKVATSKYEAIYEGLKFLNIIEHSEDNSEIRLTTEGKEFVERYIEKKGEV